MKKKQLMIGIPTKDHPKYIQYYLAKILETAKKENIDICIYDSSSGDETEKIINGRISQGYTNLYYFRYPEDILIEEKLGHILVDSGYEYVWLAGDGVVINLGKDLFIVEEEIERKRDIILFGNLLENGKKYIEYTDPVLFFKECFAPVTFYGASIVKGDLLQKKEWEYCKKRYLEHAHPACFYEMFAKENLNVVYIVHNFYEANPYKKVSAWMKKGRTFEAFSGLISRTIDLLPIIYKTEKKKVKKAIDDYTGLFAKSHLWTLRANGNLDCKIAIKYKKQIKATSIASWRSILLISLCPKKIAESVAVILGDIW